MVCVFLAEGFEEVEAVATIDFLRRAGLTVKTYTADRRAVKGSHGILVEADELVEKLKLDDTLQAVVLPGGLQGTQKLAASEEISEAIRFAAENNKIVAAICAAPSILGKMGLLKGRKAVCYPGFEKELTGAEVCEDDVVVSGNYITARAAGVTWQFAAAIVTALKSEQEADAILRSIGWKK